MSAATNNTGYHPEQHVNEEPRNDFIDVGVGMAATTIFFLAVSVLAVVIELLIR